MTVSPQDIVAEARRWLGVRYRHQGRTGEGLDCLGLVIKVAHGLGLSDFDTADYARQATDETMLELCRQYLVKVHPADLQAGDVLVMGFDQQRHMAFVADYPAPGAFSFIHAYAPSRKVVEMRLDSVWMRRVIGRFRFPGVM